MTTAPTPTRTRDGVTPPDERRRLLADLGTLVRIERVRHGWTQAALAEATGYSVRTIVRIENGTARPSETSTRALAEALRAGSSAVEVARFDLVLQNAAGESLRRWRRRRPTSVRRARVYAQARAELENPAPDPGGLLAVGRLLAALDAEGRTHDER